MSPYEANHWVAQLDLMIVNLAEMLGWPQYRSDCEDRRLIGSEIDRLLDRRMGFMRIVEGKATSFV